MRGYSRTIVSDRGVCATEKFGARAHEVLPVEDFRVRTTVGEIIGEVFDLEFVGRFEAEYGR